MSKYEGHTPEPWSFEWRFARDVGSTRGITGLSSDDRRVVEPVLAPYASMGGPATMRLALEADGHLIADAPKLLRQRDRLLEIFKLGGCFEQWERQYLNIAAFLRSHGGEWHLGLACGIEEMVRNARAAIEEIEKP